MDLDFRGVVTNVLSSFLIFLTLWVARQLVRAYRSIKKRIAEITEASQIDLANAESTEEKFAVLEGMRETIASLRHDALTGHVWGALVILVGFIAVASSQASKFTLVSGLVCIMTGWLLAMLIVIISAKRIDGLSRLIMSGFAEIRSAIRKNNEG